MKKLTELSFEGNEAKVQKMAVELAIILEKAHENGKVHGNINPENICMDENGNFKLLGWEGDGQSTGVHADNYQAPEIYQGRVCTANVDLYSLGLVLYQLMNEDCLPFYTSATGDISAEDRDNALKCRMAGETLPSPKNASDHLAEVILKACAYKSEERYQSAGEFLNEFVIDSVAEHVLEDETKTKKKSKKDSRVSQKKGFGLKKIIAGAALVLAGAVIAGGVMQFAGSEKDDAVADVSGNGNSGSDAGENNVSGSEENENGISSNGADVNENASDADKGYEEFYVDNTEILVRRYPEEDGGWLDIRYDEEYNTLTRIRFEADGSIAYQYDSGDDVCEYEKSMEYYDGSQWSYNSSCEQYYREAGFDVWVSHQYADNTAAHYYHGIYMSSDPDFKYEIKDYLVGIEYKYDENYSIVQSKVCFYYMGDNSAWSISYDDAGRKTYAIHVIYDDQRTKALSCITQLYTSEGLMSKSINSVGDYQVTTRYNADGSVAGWVESFLNESGTVTKAYSYQGIFERE